MVLSSSAEILYLIVLPIIRKEAVGGRNSVLILVALDCDSLCACKMLTAILASDDIKYSFRPVAGPEDLTQVDEELVQDNDELRAIIMINCGAGLNLLDYFTLPTDDITIFVMDSHRPYAISNILDSYNVVLIDDGVDHDKVALLNLPEDQEDDDDATRTKNRKLSEDLLRAKYAVKKTYYGLSASSLVFRFAEANRKDNLDNMLWYAIVGMSDQLVHERITEEQYLKEAKIYETLVKNTFLEEDEGRNGFSAADTISAIEDYRFMLYRHWNLYDSMYYSRYIAVRLNVWKHDGKQHLDTLLAKMGLPLDECRQPYKSMSVEMKDQMKSALQKYAKDYLLDRIMFPSFQRQIGFKEQQAAVDTVFAITALLEQDNPVNDGEIPVQENFNEAYDALANNKLDLLHKGLDRAVEHHQAIVKQGISMLEKKSITAAGPFRYGYVPETTELHFFTHPLALSRLALFLMDMIANEFGRKQSKTPKKQFKPMLLAALREKTSTYLTVGVARSSFAGEKENEFAVNFERTAKRTNSRIARNSFSGYVVEVLQNDMSRFLEQLHTSMGDL